MITFGIDIGSTTSKCVVMEDGQNILGSSLLVGGIGTKSPELAVSQALEAAGVTWDDLTARQQQAMDATAMRALTTTSASCPVTDLARTTHSPLSARLSISEDRTRR